MPHADNVTTLVITTVVNWLNLTVLWNMSGATRGKTKTTLNPEDAVAFKGQQVDADPPEVARVLRAHRNTFDNTVPFLILALVFSGLGPSTLEAQVLLYGFTAARVAYSVCYLKGLQPWRTIMYAIGVLLSLALAVDTLRLLFK